jgi:hypothetical protein
VILIATLVLLVRVTVLVLEVPDWTRPKVSVCGEYFSGPRLGLLAGSSELVAMPAASGTLSASLRVAAGATVAWAAKAAPDCRRLTRSAAAAIILRTWKQAIDLPKWRFERRTNRQSTAALAA